MKQTAIGIMRWEILKRDGFDCVPCRILGYCDPKARGWCGGIRLPSPDLNPVAYKKLDALRSGSASLRLHLSHLHTHANEGWLDLCASCPCHNLEITTEIRTACEAYTAMFDEDGTEAFAAALERRPEEKAAIKRRKKEQRHAAYEHAKKKAGGTPFSRKKPGKPAVSKSKLPAKVLEQMARPVYNGTST